MTALARVARAPGLVLVAGGLHLLLAGTVGAAARTALGAAMGPYALADNRRLWYTVLELVGTSPGLLEPIVHLLVGSAVIALGFWTVAAAAVLYRLHAPAPLPRLAAAAVRGLPGVLAVSCWHLVLRAVLLAAAALLTAPLLEAGSWGSAGILATAAVLAACTCALDLARCDVVLHGARPFHPLTAWRGFSHAAGRPAVLIRSMALSFGQWACTGAVLAAAVAGGGGGPAIWLARALTILGIVLGLIRLAVAVEAGRGCPIGARAPDRAPRLVAAE